MKTSERILDKKVKKLQMVIKRVGRNSDDSLPIIKKEKKLYKDFSEKYGSKALENYYLNRPIRNNSNSGYGF